MRTLIAVTLAAALGLAGCGGSDSDSTQPDESSRGQVLAFAGR